MKKYKLSYGKHPSQFGVLRLPESNSKNILVMSVHGGFWRSKYDLKENAPLVTDLTERGYITWNIEYRRTGEQGGGGLGTMNDALDAFNYLEKIKKKFKLEISKVILIGHSAGAQICTWLAHHLEHSTSYASNDGILSIEKIISLAGVMDLEKMYEIHMEKNIISPVLSFVGGNPDKVPELYQALSPISLFPLSIKHILLHGEIDQYVPVELSKNYYHRALSKNLNVQLITLPDVNHFNLVDPNDEAWKSVLDILI